MLKASGIKIILFICDLNILGLDRSDTGINLLLKINKLPIIINQVVIDVLLGGIFTNAHVIRYFTIKFRGGNRVLMVGYH